MGTLLHYRGYHGSIEASPEDNCLYGKVQFIRALVSYEGETVAQLDAAFREAVDDYLHTCVNRPWFSRHSPSSGNSVSHTLLETAA